MSYLSVFDEVMSAYSPGRVRRFLAGLREDLKPIQAGAAAPDPEGSLFPGEHASIRLFECHFGDSLHLLYTVTDRQLYAELDVDP